MDYQGKERARQDGTHKGVENTGKAVNPIAETDPELLQRHSLAFPQRFEYLDEPWSAFVQYASTDLLEQTLRVFFGNHSSDIFGSE